MSSILLKKKKVDPVHYRLFQQKERKGKDRSKFAVQTRSVCYLLHLQPYKQAILQQGCWLAYAARSKYKWKQLYLQMILSFRAVSFFPQLKSLRKLTDFT